jgi:hypothetical protein
LGYLWSARESLLDKLVARYKSYLNRPVDIWIVLEAWGVRKQ